MITRENLEEVLKVLGYRYENEQYVYNFKDFSCQIIVDLKNEKIIYPTNKGFIVNEKQTCNFSSNENFVVLECVHNLLKKGYRPEHIELEKRWSLGHSQKSGRADICVKNAIGSEILFIIECKTYGKEYDNALGLINKDGGQLFSYFQQEKSTKWLILYASGFENDVIKQQISTIKTFDDENLQNKDNKLYKNANNANELFEVWKQTYNQEIYKDVVFSDDCVAYNVGEKPLRKKDLEEFKADNKIINKFEEILRHNNISDKENAFNKLIVLFICKLVDEVTKNDNDIVDFQYKFGSDNYETLLDRLQRLYRDGMDKFMQEEIFYIDAQYPSNLFANLNGTNRKNAIDDLNKTFRKLKFYSNSDFAFKDVHNETLFNQNGKILVEMVRLFQNYKIVYIDKHQFLGDLFEQLLDKGFKQNEGQFFTPMPITRFIWECLPIKIQDYPKVIDYACGSGHFLIEGINAINKAKKSNNNEWVEDKIYGIEKDYRLARVSKVSLFMNGAGKAQVIFGDGLDNHKTKGVENNSFDILVANPPYSVKAFKQHLQLSENEFNLIDLISVNSSEIEVLFVERINQLLKPNAIAAVILPSSILSNNSSGYIGAREKLLKHFYVKSIVQFGNQTFGKTNTSTVVLFLQKYSEPPKKYKMLEDSIDAIFSTEFDNAWDNKEIFEEYLKYINVDKDIYIDFIDAIKNYDEFLDDLYLKTYIDDFKKSKDYNDIKNKKSFTKDEINKKFYTKYHEIEKEKMLYFALLKNQKTLIIKAPEDNKAQKEFLGYEWSNRKGDEGIKIFNLGGELFDENNPQSDEFIAPLIKKAFNNEEIEEIKNTTLLNTKDMIDFKKVEFNKEISIVLKKSIEIKSKYQFEFIKNIFVIESGARPKGGVSNIKEGVISLGGEHIDNENGSINLENLKYIPYDFYNMQQKGKIRKDDILLCKDGARTGKIALVRNEFDNQKVMINEHIFLMRVLNAKMYHYKMFYYFLLSMFGQNLLKSIITGAAQGGLNKTNLENLKIPTPPLKIQEKIVKECDEIEKVYETTRMKIQDYQKQIQDVFKELKVIENGGGV